ncbi:hypothetical protein FBU30_005837 [Linnemannia zychae]|nr:hypothetical protein FBU30_005837 [Linnemannia zychae]
MESSFPLHESIQAQRRALAEDTVSYAIYLPALSSSSITPTLTAESAIRVKDNAHVLESVELAKTLISSIVAEVCKGYIWHKDAFSLSIVSGQGQGSTDLPYLRGQTRFGDSIDDEWVIVYLLREITKRIPGSIAKIQDNDGDFLLIEAANYIPTWLDPENSDNRVFIYQGSLHIIPIPITTHEKKTLPTTLGTKSRSPKLQDALDLIRSNTSTSTTGSAHISTLANPTIQQAAFAPLSVKSQDRLSFVQWKIREQRHYVRCQIPVRIAQILKARPELVTRAVEAFYTRDALAMATCSRMTKFLPPLTSSLSTNTETSSTSKPVFTRLGKNKTPFVTTAVCFTKACYAQLMGQKFQPPKIWDGIVPPPKMQDGQEDPEKVKEAELGMKLTCGFEILCSDDYPGDFGFRTREDIQIDSFPFATDESWRIFKINLTSLGYFGNERQGSAQYRQLEENAKKQFLENKANLMNEAKDNLDAHSLTSFYGHEYHPIQEINRILADGLDTIVSEDLVDNRKSDDDSWMDVDLQDLEDMMRARGFGGGDQSTGNTGSSSGLDMQHMLNQFEAFVEEGEGGVEGAEFLDEMSDEDDDDDDGDNQESTDKQEEYIEMSDTNNTDESDDDIFASDYEEKQAAKRAAKAKRNNKSGSGPFLFGANMMSFDNGVSSVTSSELEGNKEKSSGTFAMDHSKFKDILVQTFGTPTQSSRFTTANNTDDMKTAIEDEEQDDMDDEDIKEYMTALDAELASTKVGQSFEKSTSTASTNKEPAATFPNNKGKGVPPRDTAQKSKKPEKNLEELMKEATARSRRGFSRHGPLGMTSGPSFGYDPMGMSFADDEDEEEEGIKGPRVSTISAEGEVGDELDELDNDNDEEMDREMVDLDLNLAKNLLESFKSQGGLPGPGGNILSRLGIVLPRDDEDDDSDE